MGWSSYSTVDPTLTQVHVVHTVLYTRYSTVDPTLTHVHVVHTVLYTSYSTVDPTLTQVHVVHTELYTILYTSFLKKCHLNGTLNFFSLVYFTSECM